MNVKHASSPDVTRYNLLSQAKCDVCLKTVTIVKI